MSKWANTYAPELFKNYIDWYDNLVDDGIEPCPQMKEEAINYFSDRRNYDGYSESKRSEND